jgi:hypothetical protein
MAANVNPIFPLTPNCGVFSLLAADTTKTGTTLSAVWTAGVNGARLYRITLFPQGTNVQTVVRVFVNDGGDIADAANNAIFREFTLAASTLSETNAQPGITIPIDEVFPAGWRIMVAIGTAVAAGWVGTLTGADY